MVELAIESDLHNALNILLRYARRYAVKSSSAAAVAADCVSGQEWRPSSGQVAAALLAALSAFLVAPSGKVPVYYSLGIILKYIMKLFSNWSIDQSRVGRFSLRLGFLRCLSLAETTSPPVALCINYGSLG